MSFPPVDEQITYLKKGLAELIREEELRERLAAAAKENRPLRVKAGFDPTAPDLHLGHTVLLRKMKHFQDLGHQVIFLIGDMSGLIGDPSGRNITRPPMTREEIARNAETYKEQVFKILDPARTEVVFNSTWLEPLRLEDIIHLGSKYTVARLLERDDFSRRYKEGHPISVHEFIYPLATGYDSVVLQNDVEMGGIDQKFNLLVHRELQRDYGVTPQIIAMVPLLEGLDGVEKMSKSKGNYIGITEPPKVMFRKVMQISDELMYRYYELLTDTSIEEIGRLRQAEPMQTKLELARRIVKDFHGEAEAKHAHEAFDREVRHGLEPSDTETVALPAQATSAKGIRIDKLLAAVSLADSVTDAVRKLKAGAVEIDGRIHHELLLTNAAGVLTIRVGKKWKRVDTVV